jgi:hypothetical protein
MEMVSREGEKVTALDDYRRTNVLHDRPFFLSAWLADRVKAGAIHLRTDFVYHHLPHICGEAHG